MPSYGRSTGWILKDGTPTRVSVQPWTCAVFNNVFQACRDYAAGGGKGEVFYARPVFAKKADATTEVTIIAERDLPEGSQ